MFISFFFVKYKVVTVQLCYCTKYKYWLLPVVDYLLVSGVYLNSGPHCYTVVLLKVSVIKPIYRRRK